MDRKAKENQGLHQNDKDFSISYFHIFLMIQFTGFLGIETLNRQNITYGLFI